jgi:ribose 5-phosphate isomerase A
LQAVKRLGGSTTLRESASGKIGPIISDNGNFLMDAHFDSIGDAARLNLALLQIPGVVETGLFIGMAQRVYFGEAETVKVWNAGANNEV